MEDSLYTLDIWNGAFSVSCILTAPGLCRFLTDPWGSCLSDETIPTLMIEKIMGAYYDEKIGENRENTTQSLASFMVTDIMLQKTAFLIFLRHCLLAYKC